MFEKEADEMAVNNAKKKYGLEGSVCMNIQECAYVNGFQDGAEFGYRKANEWNTETPSSAVGNKDLLLRVAKDDFDVGYYHFEKKRFYTNDGKEVVPIAWKEIQYIL
jgi:hypothetical protein